MSSSSNSGPSSTNVVAAETVASSPASAAVPVLPTPTPDMALARQLFDILRADSFDGVGVTRDSYGTGEQRAHEQIRTAAEALGLSVRTDAALNLYITLPGQERTAPARVTGSHLDSVPRGGNFDGAAGVIAGLAVVAGCRAAGVTPPADIVVIGIRAEESAWFPFSYIGSKAALGQLPEAALAVRRADNGRTLEESLIALGGDTAPLRQRTPGIDIARIARFVELHIEQGPVLEEAGEPVGVVTGICGSVRYREASALGAYKHSGATPRSHRQDAVVAVARLVSTLHDDWCDLEAQGHELTFTVGRFETDRRQADFSKVPGRVDFCIDVRSRSHATMQAMEARILAATDAIARQYGVAIDLGPRTSSEPAAMDAALCATLTDAARAAGWAYREMPSGAGHDAALFATAGVPTAMIFVRNQHGSHNPQEAMQFPDFEKGTQLLAQLLLR
ncbi:Zn-dependent hydrolase [Robbsia sp. KACC 23696]|uniref:Zn-dependent hydrolase n=1 Tax=Robbsia sp. KACC 23696 TaxID=3149231 RepID=UPI00325BF078